ncbi:PIG-L family deacetylase [Candidatus Microgenomates bacterium]|nr:PIG-L family deacetylase [Candidatus Microgenomates bacterium]
MVPVVLIVIVALIWVGCMVAFNDLLLPSINIERYKNILLIFSHMDDETVLAGGIMAQVAAMGKHITLMTLTQGEKGNDKRIADVHLPAIRRAELAKVLHITGVKDLIHLNYQDETLTTKKNALKKDIDAAIKTVQPDLVITFDLEGWYGHPDHIACAEAVTEVVKKSYPKTALWYAVRPEAIHRAARLVKRLSGGALSKRTAPTHKLFIGSSVIKKIRSIYCYQSQMSALAPGVTIGPIPMWFFMSAQPFEYIVKAQATLTHVGDIVG